MRAVIQRVSKAKVEVNGEIVSEIDHGLVTFLGISKVDDRDSIEKGIQKIVSMRIFSDEEGKLNRSILDVGGDHLLISQFTLLANTDKGNRPSFVDAAPPQDAKHLYEKALEKSLELGVKTFPGRFGADMQVTLTNDGPVTIVLEI